jgi:predicted anti-sigma-YlaC factor YlaD
MRADAAGAPRAEPAARERIVRMPREMSQNVGTEWVSAAVLEDAATARELRDTPLATAAAAVPRPAIFRKRRREIRWLKALQPAVY